MARSLPSRLPVRATAAVAAVLLAVVLLTLLLGAWQVAVVAVAVLQVLTVGAVLLAAQERRADLADLRASLARDHSRVLTDLARLAQREDAANG